MTANPNGKQTATDIEAVAARTDVRAPGFDDSPVDVDGPHETSAADYMAEEDADAVAQRLRELGYL